LGLLGLPNATNEDELCSLEDLYECNASLLQDQRTRYRALVEKHEAALQAFMAEGANEEEEATEEEAPATETNDTAALDPLTAMVREQEAQEKRRQELELKYRKERARRNRGIYEGEAGGDSHNGTTDAVSLKAES